MSFSQIESGAEQTWFPTEFNDLDAMLNEMDPMMLGAADVDNDFGGPTAKGDELYPVRQASPDDFVAYDELDAVLEARPPTPPATRRPSPMKYYRVDLNQKEVLRSLAKPAAAIRPSKPRLLSANAVSRPLGALKNSKRRATSPSPSVTSNGSKWGNSGSKQAVYAREYRQKNKQQMDSMSERINELEGENSSLHSKLEKMESSQVELRDEVAYLKSVLANQGPLAALISGVQSSLNGSKITIPLESPAPSEPEQSLPNTRGGHKRRAPSGSTVPSKRLQQRSSQMPDLGSPGVCLHVQSGAVSIEFCGKCNRGKQEQLQQQKLV